MGAVNVRPAAEGAGRVPRRARWTAWRQKSSTDDAYEAVRASAPAVSQCARKRKAKRRPDGQDRPACVNRHNDAVSTSIVQSSFTRKASTEGVRRLSWAKLLFHHH